VLPAHERLHGDDLLVVGRHDGLVDEAKLVVVEGGPQVGLQLESGDRAGVDARLVHGVAGPAGALGPVHGLVRPEDQLGGVVVGPSGDRHPDTAGDDHLVLGHPEGLRKRAADPVGHLGRGIEAADGLEQDHELVPAEPGDHVALFDRTRQSTADGDEQLVARVVAEAVVDRLEPVQVDEEDCGPLVHWCRPGQ